MGTVSADAGEKSVFYNGKEYATLDFTPPRAGAISTQKDFLELPEGWVLAEPSDGLVEEVIAKFPWGTNVMVLRNGNAYWTSIAHQSPGKHYGGGKLEQSGRGFRPVNANCRVLICTEVCPEPAADGDQCTRAMALLWETGDFADCEVVCNGHVFQCHRAVLSQVSPVFKQMLSGEMLEAKAQRIQLEALETETEAASAFLTFVYTGALDYKSEHFSIVIKLADFYQLNCITAKTYDNMLRVLDKGNVVPIARLLKSMREKPHIEPYWAKLIDKVQQRKELAAVVLSEL